MTADQVAAKFDAQRHGRAWSARCPCHDDSKPSLGIGEGKNGNVVVTCRAGCETAAVLAAVGLELSDLFPPKNGKANGHGRHIVATYDYRDEKGRLLFQVCRFDPKDFRQRRPSGDTWSWSLGDVRRVLYRLPELLAADPEELVFIVEGEKDADRLAELGLVATTNAGGAGKWRPEYDDALRGRDVAIIADNDEPGQKHAETVARALHPIAVRVRIVELPGLPAKGDVSDWLVLHDAEALRHLVASSPAWEPPPTGQTKSTRTTPLPGIVVSQVEERAVDWLWFGRIPIGKLTLLDGNPGLGKSLLTIDVAARVSTGQPFYGCAETSVGPGAVLIVTNEDDTSDTIRPRLVAARANLDLVRHERDLSLPTHMERLVALALFYEKTETPLRLVVIDPLPAFLDEDVDPNSAASIRKALTPLALFAARFRLAVVIVRHFTKRGEGAAVTRGSGNIAIIGQARSGLLIATDPDDKTARVMSMTKHNLAKNPSSLRYRIGDDQDGKPVVQWLGASEIDAEELIAPRRKGGGARQSKPSTDTKLGECIDWLAERLKREPGQQALASELFLEARRLEYSERTMKRAKEHLPIESRTLREQGRILGHVWRLLSRIDLEPQPHQSAKPDDD